MNLISFISKFILIFLVTGISSGLCQLPMQYQDRGNRWEGILAKTDSSSDVGLVSVLVNYQETDIDQQDSIKIKFYLENRARVYVTVRDLYNNYSYQMDKIKPKNPWQTGFDNTFAWPVNDVLQHIDGLDIFDLGAIARLNNWEASVNDIVAPVILYCNTIPMTIDGYLFTFTVRKEASLVSSIFEKESNIELFSRSFLHQYGNKPFTIQWDCTKANIGWYKLVLKGFFSDTTEPIYQSVEFYHQALVR